MPLDWPLRVRRPIAASIRSVLLVAGPSWSGKSTFLEHMRSGALPDEIKAQFPLGCESWAETSFRDFRSLFETRSGPEPADIQFHYDTTRAYRARWSSYFQDPRLRAVAQAGTVVVVTLKPTRGQLCDQFGPRAFRGETRAQTRDAMQRAEPSTLRDPPDEPVSKFKRRPLSPAEVVAYYQTQGWLKTWSQHWDELVAHLAKCGPLTKEVLVAPTGQPYDDRERRWTCSRSSLPGGSNLQAGCQHLEFAGFHSNIANCA